jgi:hypothetical protein
MEQFLIDSNVISDYFSASLPENGLQFMDSVIDAVPKFYLKVLRIETSILIIIASRKPI